MNKFYIYVIVVIMAVLLVACNNNAISTFIDLDKLSVQVLESANFKDEVMELDKDVIRNIYTSLNLDDIERYKVFVSATNAKAEEIALFEAKTEDAAQKVMDAIKVRIEDLRYGFEGYIPEELKNVENAVVIREGKYVLLGIGENYNKIREVFEEWIKNKK